MALVSPPHHAFKGMIRSGKQLVNNVGWSVARGQQARSAVSAALPPIVRAHMFALRKAPPASSSSAADMTLCRSFQISPLSMLARATMPSVEMKHRGGGKAAGGKGMPLQSRGDLRGLDNM